MKDVYTLEDLETRARLDAGAEKPARLAVIGRPIAHSASPRMHQAALDALGQDVRYIRLDVAPGQVGVAFARMRELGFIGCNVTVPHKLEALAHCEAHADALTLGAVNTIRFDPDATRGFNTDGPGFELAVKAAFGTELAGLKVAIAGAGGGAGQAISAQCWLSGVRKLVLINRSWEKLLPFVEKVRTHSPGMEVVLIPFEDASLVSHVRDCDLIVNTSSVGLGDGDPSVLPQDCLRKEQSVYDTIYQPPVTPLLALAARAGSRTANGLSMLVNQGALAFQHWFPGSHPLDFMRKEMKR